MSENDWSELIYLFQLLTAAEREAFIQFLRRLQDTEGN